MIPQVVPWPAAVAEAPRRVRGLVLAGSLLGAPLAAAQDAMLPLQGVDVYGTDAFDGAAVKAEFGAELDELAAAIAEGDPEARFRVADAITDGLSERGDFAYLEVGSIRYYPPNEAIYVTIDVVEQEDAASRMPFRETPQSAAPEDPGGAIALWEEYEDELRPLAMAGELEYGECEVLHCLAPFGVNPELEPYLAAFNERAETHEDDLYDIVTEGPNALQRATAIFLLAHTGNVERLLPVLGDAIYDPSAAVRNNAMRVLAEMIRADPDRPFPASDLAAAMDFPSVSDRNKAASAVALLAESPRHRPIIRETAVPTALRLLRLEQPNNHDPAYELLKTLSGEDFGPRAYEQWRAFFSSEPSRDCRRGA